MIDPLLGLLCIVEKLEFSEGPDYDKYIEYLKEGVVCDWKIDWSQNGTHWDSTFIANKSYF